MLRYLNRHTVRKGFELKTYGFRNWNGICFPIYMYKGQNHSITCHFIVPRNIIVVISENLHVYTGLHCCSLFFTVTTGKMAIALKIITL